MDASRETNPPHSAGRLAPSAGDSWVLGVDISETEGQITGVGRYTLELLKAWLSPSNADASQDAENANAGGQPTIVLFARNHDRVPAELRASRAHIVASSDQGDYRHGVVRWQQLDLARLLRRQAQQQRPIDLLFCPAYAIPLLTRTPTVVALHDLSFERDPSAFSRKEGFRRRFLARSAARRSRGIVTISDFSRSEIAELYAVSESKILTVYPGCDRSIFSRDAKASARADSSARHSLDTPPFLLAVGTLLRRRNIAQLIEAFAKLDPRFNQHELVIVGSNQTRRPVVDFPAIASAHQVADRVRFLPHVNEDQLVHLYRNTDLLVSLSEYEGFGLPTLEALCCGAPVLLLQTKLHQELWSGVVPMVAGTDPTAIATAIDGAAGRQPRAQVIDHLVRERFNQDLGAAKVLRFLHQASVG